jgi:putative peptidoglycan lipid II flippase
MLSKRHLLRSSITVGAFSFISSLTGILLEMSIASKLGLSRSSDIFYVAFTAPYVITTLLSATGQFSLVPFFASLDAGGEKEKVWLGFSYALNVVLLGLGVVAVAGAAASPWIIRLIAPGFTHAQSHVAASLTRYLFFLVIPAGAAEIFRSFLYSRHRFALAASSGFVRNACVIVFTLATFKHYGYSSIVLGYFAGYLLQLLLLGGQVMISFPVCYTLRLKGAGVNFEKLRHTGSAQLAGALGWQGVVLAERIIASFLPPGAITALNYGLKIMSTLSEVLTGSVGTGALPSLSRAEARRDVEESQKLFRHALEISTVPAGLAMVLCLALPRCIMRLIFEHGLFNTAAASRMGHIFFYYALSLPLYSAVRLVIFYLFARGESRNFLKLSGFHYTLTVAFDLLFVGVFHAGAKGIPLGLLASLVVTCAMMYWYDFASLRDIVNRSFVVFVAKVTAACIITALLAEFLRRIVSAGGSAFGLFWSLTLICGASSLVFIAVLMLAKALSVSQIASLWKPSEAP